ncbi:hypothetical protein BLA3211_08060 [Burkholderia aenigmatica]|uniref:Uncharacterized protein n=1 Tax=Burkholderia aenigmatica TaxID=2015348 RepID=A0A6J5JT22_9BURK|nr:hypothetical protein BLA3211_08060 [Burkholderia aenigmatica]
MSTAARAYFDKQLQAARQELRRKVQVRELMEATPFAKRLGISLLRLARLESSGSVFSVDIDGTPHYPALLASHDYEPRRLRKICRIIYPAPASARWHFLTTRWGSLGGLSPLEAMRTDDGYLRLLTVAKSWSAQWWRTAVEIYDAGDTYDGATPICTGTVEQDPRISAWRRASAALSDSLNMRPAGPYPRLNSATVLVTRTSGGTSERVPEFQLDVTASGGVGYASIRADAVPRTLGPIPVSEVDDIVAVVRKLLATEGNVTCETCSS